MTSTSASIFKNGKLKAGVYKIKNIHTETYLDIHESSKRVCCRPAKKLGDQGGRVRLFSWSMVHVPDDQKWEIKPLGAGYSVQRVRVVISVFPGFAC